MQPKDITINCFTGEVVYDSGLKRPTEWLVKNVITPFLEERKILEQEPNPNPA